MHFDEIFFAHNGFHHEPQIVGRWIPIALPHDLAWILGRKFELQILIPIRIDLKLSFPDPFGVVPVDACDLQVCFDIEFLQSGPD